ncbi:MAG TPA: YncE family protein [Thermoplasmata archaeon]|nr:YncE family protein [Thermoplasmata archaeon]
MPVRSGARRPYWVAGIGAVVLLLVLSSSSSLAGGLGRASSLPGGPSPAPSGPGAHAPASPAAGAGSSSSVLPAVGTSVVGPGGAEPGVVNDTFDLLNGTRLPGAFATANGEEPLAVAFVPGVDRLYVSVQSGGVLAVDPSAATVVAEISLPGLPRALAYDPGNGLLYVTGEGGPSGVFAVDPTTETVVGTTLLGGYPESLAVDNATQDLYIGLSNRNGTGTLDVVAAGNGSLVGSILVAHPLVSVVYDPANGLLYGSSPGTSTLTVVSGADERVLGSIPVGLDPGYLAVDAQNDTIYAPDSGGTNVTVIDGGSNTAVASIPTGVDPWAATWDGVAGELAVLSNPGPGAALTLIDPTNASTLGVVPLPPDSTPFAVDATDGLLYGGTGLSNLTAVDPSTAAVRSTIRLGSEPVSIQVDPIDGDLLVVDFAASEVLVVAPSNGSIVEALPAGPGPRASVFDPANGLLYVASDSGAVYVLDPAGDRSVARIPVGLSPSDLALDPADGRLYVSDEGSANISVILLSNDSTVGSIPLSSSPYALAYDAVNGELYVATDSENITVVATSNDTVVGEVALGCFSADLFVEPGDGDLVAECSGEGWVGLVDPTDNEVTVRIPALLNFDPYPQPIALDPRSGYLYVSDGSFSLAVIDTENDSFLGLLTVGLYPTAVAWDAARGTILVTNFYSGSVSEVSPRYLLTFTEGGLPAKVLGRDGWSVSVDGISTPGLWTRPSATFAVANGSYPYLIVGPHGYRATGFPSTGTLSVHDAGANDAVVWVHGATVRLRLEEKGLPTGTTWCVAVAGEPVCSAGRASQLANLTAGDYAYSVTTPLAGETIGVRVGHTELGPAGVVDLTRSARLVVTFTYPYEVTFVASGLGSTPWSVTIHGVMLSNATGGPIVFELPNGTYHAKVGHEAGLSAKVVPTPVRVAGAPTTVGVTFSPRR